MKINNSRNRLLHMVSILPEYYMWCKYATSMKEKGIKTCEHGCCKR